MRLYPKKLHNLHQLEKERRQMKYEKKELDKSGLPFLGKSTKDDRKDGKDTDGGYGAMLGSLGASPWLATIIDIGLPLIQKMRRKKAERKVYEAAGVTPPHKKNVLKTAAVEFIGGYLKWKAIELSLKGIKKLVSKKKQPVN